MLFYHSNRSLEILLTLDKGEIAGSQKFDSKFDIPVQECD